MFLHNTESDPLPVLDANKDDVIIPLVKPKEIPEDIPN